MLHRDGSMQFTFRGFDARSAVTIIALIHYRIPNALTS